MEISFTGKRALVTGGSQGIGRHIAKELSKYGAKVVALDINTPELESLKSEDPNIEIVTVDLSDWNTTKCALNTVGDIDLLVNSAGLVILEPLLNISEDSIDRLFNINIKAIMNVTQYVAKNIMDRKCPGSIVNISSQASMAALQDHAVYCATKGALDAFTRVAALELGRHNIRVNAVNPTVIMTDLGRLAWSDPKKAEAMLQKIPLGRFGEVNEVSDAVLYLLSDKASMITGITMPIDGGFLAT